MSAKPQVAVSYSWKEEREGANTGAVERFCTSLRQKDVEVIRDKDRVKHGECLSKFMREVGASPYLCVFLSDAYLKSPNCMYELVVAWQYNKDNPEAFGKRVKVWVMPGAEKIFDIRGRVECAKYWEQRWNADEPVFSENRTLISGASHDEHSLMKEFVSNAEAILKFFAGRLSTGSEEEYEKWIRAELGVGAAADDANLAEVYANTLYEIDELLGQHPGVAEFLMKTVPNFIQATASGFALAPSVKTQRMEICPRLEKIAKAVPSFRGTVGDWQALGELAGGLVVLVVDPKWILAERIAARSKSSEFPADAETISVGRWNANLLHVVSSALADGRARLEKVFGKPPLDDFRVPDPAAVMLGIRPDDVGREIKLHLIRFVLGSHETVDARSERDIEIKFGRTKKVMSAAFNDAHTAYVGSGDTFKLLISMIRDNLKVQDLLLLHPSGDDPEKLVTDYVRVLRFVGTIFDAVKANGPK